MTSQKVTKRANPAAKRRYDDACAAAHGLDILGERWALLVVRELMFGPKRFSDLRASLPGISANVLTQRLEGLEASFVVERRKLPPPAAAWVYALTEWGAELEPVFQSLGRWAARSPSHDPRKPVGATSVMMSLRTMLDSARAADLRGTVGFRFGEEVFMARFAEGELSVARDPAAQVDAWFETMPGALVAVLYGGRPLADAEADGSVRVAGDRALVERFLTLFPLPAKYVPVAAR